MCVLVRVEPAKLCLHCVINGSEGKVVPIIYRSQGMLVEWDLHSIVEFAAACGIMYIGHCLCGGIHTHTHTRIHAKTRVHIGQKCVCMHRIGRIGLECV